MNPSEYNKLAARTESPITPELLGRLVNCARLLHGVMGLVTEAGEMMDQLKKHVFYGKPLDKLNLKEETGDSFWYFSIVTTEIDASWESIMEGNIAKLQKRYPEKFDAEKALNRDTDAELVALAEHVQETHPGMIPVFVKKVPPDGNVRCPACAGDKGDKIETQTPEGVIFDFVKCELCGGEGHVPEELSHLYRSIRGMVKSELCAQEALQQWKQKFGDAQVIDPPKELKILCRNCLQRNALDLHYNPGPCPVCRTPYLQVGKVWPSTLPEEPWPFDSMEEMEAARKEWRSKLEEEYIKLDKFPLNFCCDICGACEKNEQLAGYNRAFKPVCKTCVQRLKIPTQPKLEVHVDYSKLKLNGHGLTPEQMRKEGDWDYAFYEAAHGVYLYGNSEHNPNPLDDVVEVIGAIEGENGEGSWLCVVKMKDGRYAVMDASCDFTGWDCQAGGEIDYYDTLGEAITNLTPAQAERLGAPHDAVKK